MQQISGRNVCTRKLFLGNGVTSTGSSGAVVSVRIGVYPFFANDMTQVYQLTLAFLPVEEEIGHPQPQADY